MNFRSTASPRQGLFWLYAPLPCALSILPYGPLVAPLLRLLAPSLLPLKQQFAPFYHPGTGTLNPKFRGHIIL